MSERIDADVMVTARSLAHHADRDALVNGIAEALQAERDVRRAAERRCGELESEVGRWAARNALLEQRLAAITAIAQGRRT